MNFLDLTIFAKNLKAIHFLIYPDILGVLEYYLELTGYLYNYIYFYI